MHTHPRQRRGRAWPTRLAPASLATAAALALAACGGGSDATNTPPPTPPTPAPALTLSRTAATGAALANAPVEARCSGGNGTATTAADGSFTVSNLPAGAALPCVLKATGPGGALFSLATGTGTAVRANVTPLTTLVLTHLAGGTPASYFEGWNASAASALTAAAVQQSVDAVKATLAAGGLDLASTDLLAGALVAATGSSAGNAHDQALDALNARLAAAGTTLAELATSLAAANPRPLAGTPGPSNGAALPPDLLLKPRASNCAALRSGSYRSIDLEVAATQDYPQGGGFPTLPVSIDAAALTVTDNGDTVRLVPAGNCRYTIADGQGVEPDAEVLVTGAGVVLIRYLTENVNGVWRAAVVLPVQSHTLADLAGDWNQLAYDRDQSTSPHVLRTSTGTLSATGAIRGRTRCAGLATGCEADASTARVVADGAGGFFLEGDGWRDRLFAYRAGGGEFMLLSVTPDGEVGFFTRKQARTLPTVGDVSEGWQFSIAPSGSSAVSFTAATAVNPFKSTVASVDASQMRYVRQAVIDQTANVTRPETLVLNSPRDGFVQRLAANGVVRSDGATSTVNEWVGLPLRGMGFTVLGFVASNQMWWSAAAVP